MASDSSLQFKEPAVESHPSSKTNDTSSGTAKPPALVTRQSSVSKIAHVAKNLVKSPAGEQEQLQLEKTVSEEAKKGAVDVSVLEA